MPSSFYGKLYAEAYDGGTKTQAIGDFYLKLWKQLGNPNPVLEPMCGTGLNLIPFLEAGADIDGLDSSPHMLALCRKKLEDKGLESHLYEQTIQAMLLPRQYQFIFIPDRSFAHIYEKPMAQACLKRLWECLLPNGYLVFDVKTLAQLGNFGQPGQTSFGLEDRPDGSTVFSTGIWGELQDGCVIRNWNKFEKYVDGKLVETEVFDYRERLYDRVELEEMLTSAGFEDISVLKSYEHVAPNENDDLVFICRKAGA
jgi:hypothetical protein